MSLQMVRLPTAGGAGRRGVAMVVGASMRGFGCRRGAAQPGRTRIRSVEALDEPRLLSRVLPRRRLIRSRGRVCAQWERGRAASRGVCPASRGGGGGAGGDHPKTKSAEQCRSDQSALPTGEVERLGVVNRNTGADQKRREHGGGVDAPPPKISKSCLRL